MTAYFDVIGSDLEIGVGHTVTEGVTDWYFRKGIEVTVSNEIPSSYFLSSGSPLL